jgi:hypothetical protein
MLSAGQRSRSQGDGTPCTNPHSMARDRNMVPIRWLALLSACLLLISTAAAAQTPTLTIELEGGPAWQSYNDVEIPNDGSATRFSLYDLAGRGSWPAGRVYITWNPAQRHSFRLLVAPFSLTETGVPAEAIRFAGAEYSPGQPAEATYTFNSYRLGYRYRLHASDRTTAWIGFTGKIRDAVIALEQNGVKSKKTDLGFVPLLHVAGEWGFAPRWSLGLDADALAGGPGRAADVALKLGFDIGDPWKAQAGYRTVEGGADVEEVYTFAWLHYAVVSLTWRR